ncbi:hypothetical protein, partial [Mesorhizobium sp. Primo-B]
MPNHLAEIYANNADLVILGGIATLASVGLYLMLRRIRRLTSDESEGESDPPEEASWDWESPVDLA